MERETRLNIRLSQEEKTMLEQAARKEDITLATAIRQIILKWARGVLGKA